MLTRKEAIDHYKIMTVNTASLIPTLQAYDVMWGILSEYGLLGTFTAAEHTIIEKSYVYTQNHKAVVSVPTLDHALKFINSFANRLAKLKVTNTSLEFNYLGTQETRNLLLNYWKSLYWIHQTNEDIVHSDQSELLLTKPYLITRLPLAISSINPQTTLDFLKTKELELLKTLTQSLMQLTLNPLYIPTLDTSIVAKFEVEKLRIQLEVAKEPRVGFDVSIHYEYIS
jgi:hypothetical protein